MKTYYYVQYTILVYTWLIALTCELLGTLLVGGDEDTGVSGVFEGDKCGFSCICISM